MKYWIEISDSRTGEPNSPNVTNAGFSVGLSNKDEPLLISCRRRRFRRRIRKTTHLSRNTFLLATRAYFGYLAHLVIVVTGASGHVGNVFVRRLVDLGTPRLRLFLEERDPAPALADVLQENPHIEVFRGDITDAAAVSRAFEGASEVFHLAAVICIHADSALSALALKVNAEGAKNVIEACLQHQVGHLTYVSTVHALSEPPAGGTISEACGFDPERVYGAYGISKALAARSVLEAIKNRGLRATILCPTGIMGPHDYRGSDFGVMINLIANGGMAIGIDASYDFVDIHDVIEAMMRIRGGEFIGEVFLLPGHTVKFRDLMPLCARVAGVPAPNFFMPMWLCKFLAAFEPLYAPLMRTFLGRRPMMTKYSMHTVGMEHRFDGRKAADKLGHKPRPLEESVRVALEWHKNNGGRA